MAQKLASDLGLGVGISSGCNFLAALLVQEQLGPESTVVTVLIGSDCIRTVLNIELLQFYYSINLHGCRTKGLPLLSYFGAIKVSSTRQWVLRFRD